MAWRGDDGEHGYGGGAATVASAMAWESEGERHGRMDVSTGFGARRGAHPGQQGGERRKQGDGKLRGARWCRRQAPACLPGEGKQLAGAAAGLGQLGGPGVGLPGKFLSLFFLFMFSISSVTLWLF